MNDADPEKDWKRNILQLRDQTHPTAVADAGKGATYTGSIPPLTLSIHSKHTSVINPNTGATLEPDGTHTACYLDSVR